MGHTTCTHVGSGAQIAAVSSLLTLLTLLTLERERRSNLRLFSSDDVMRAAARQTGKGARVPPVALRPFAAPTQSSVTCRVRTTPQLSVRVHYES